MIYICGGRKSLISAFFPPFVMPVRAMRKNMGKTTKNALQNRMFVLKYYNGLK